MNNVYFVKYSISLYLKIMSIPKQDIIRICENNIESFTNDIKKICYLSHGILNSEMLLFISLVKYFGVNLIIESGRSKGYSTNILAESFKNFKYKIFSVEYDKYSPNVKISFERLRKYKNLNLIFGNSFDIIPQIIKENCCILIDGPKGFKSIKLAVKLLQNPYVKAIFIHDLYRDSPFRKDAEKIFSNYFFTDDYDYVNKFKILDKQCRLNIRNYDFNFSLYPKEKNPVKSYSFTLMVIFNDNTFIIEQNYRALLTSKDEIKQNLSIKFLFETVIQKMKKIPKFPFYYIYFEKVVCQKKNLNFLDLIKKWIKLFIQI